MRLLQRSFDVKTRFGGNFVQEIDGVSGGREDGRRVDWFYYVNGIEASQGAGERKLALRRPHLVGPPRLGDDDARPGRRRRVPGAVQVRAATGKKLPIRLVCMGAEDALVRRGRDAAARRRRAQRRALEPRVLARRGPAHPRRALARRAQGHRGPPARGRARQVSGVFAKPTASGNRIALIDADGDVRAHARPGRRPRRGDELRGAAPDLADHRHRRRRRGRGRRRADRGPAARPLRARDRGGPRGAAAARDAVTPALAPQPAARHPRGRRRRVVPGARRDAAGAPSIRRCWSRCSRVEMAAALAAGLGRELRRTAAWGVPFALAVVVDQRARHARRRDGLLPRAAPAVGGQIDITLEALVYGGVLGLRILAIFGTAVFLAAAVDADELLRGAAPRLAALRRDRGARDAAVRRAAPRRAARSRTRSAACPAAARRGSRCCTRSPPARWTAPPTSPRRSRSAASASRAGRRGCRGPGRATTSPSPPRRSRCSRSPSACSPARGAQFEAYPRLSAPLTPATLIAIAALAVCALLPFADRRGDRAMSALRVRRPSATAIPGASGRRSTAVSLTVEPGELVLLAGGSGSGKSTLLRAAAGLVPHFHGGTFAGTRARPAGSTRASTGRRGSPRSPGRCSRTPRRRS